MRFSNLVRPFVPEVGAFKEILLRHGAVISGSLSLYFFLPSDYWYPNGMDVFVAHSQFAAFNQALEADLSLQVVPYTQPTFSFRDDFAPWNPSESVEIVGVRRYLTPTGRYLDVMQSRRETPLSPLVECWTSLLTNFVSPNGCGAAYPKLMFEGRGFVKDSSLTSREKGQLLTYMARRFTKGRAFWFLSKDWGTWRSPSWWKKFEDYFCDSMGLVVDFGMTHPDSRGSLPVQPLSEGWKLRIPFPMGAYSHCLVMKGGSIPQCSDYPLQSIEGEGEVESLVASE